MERGGSVYFVTNKNNTVIYTGVTSELKSRIYDHKTKKYPDSFTAKYNCNKLVYFENYSTIIEAIAREKQIKGGSRKTKIDLINKFNPEWNDLYETLDLNN